MLLVLAALLFFLVQITLLSSSLSRSKSFFVFVAASFSFTIALGMLWAGFQIQNWVSALLAASAVAFAWNGLFLVLLGLEERLLEKARRKEEPISLREVEEGIQWKELERWLQKNSSQ